jgi:hypothetical protein
MIASKAAESPDFASSKRWLSEENIGLFLSMALLRPILTTPKPSRLSRLPSVRIRRPVKPGSILNSAISCHSTGRVFIIFRTTTLSRKTMTAAIAARANTSSSPHRITATITLSATLCLRDGNVQRVFCLVDDIVPRVGAPLPALKDHKSLQTYHSEFRRQLH